MHWENKSTPIGNDEDGVVFLHLEKFFRRKGHGAEEATILAYAAMDALEKLSEGAEEKAEWIWQESGPEDYEKYWVCPCCGERSYVQSNYCPDCGKPLKQQMPKEKSDD